MTASIKAPKRKTARNKAIANLAKKAKQFQRTDYGGKNQIEAIYDFIDDEILAKGGKLSKDTKYLVAKAIQKHSTKQVASCRKRTSPPLNEVIRLAGGK